LPAPAVVVLQVCSGLTPTSDASATTWLDKASSRQRLIYKAYDREAGVRDVWDTADIVATLPECTGNVGLLGHCLGALMVFLTAARYRVDAAVAYHGGDTVEFPNQRLR
jgi:dienelactone hydrolase